MGNPIFKSEIRFKNRFFHFSGLSIPFEIHLFSIFPDFRIFPLKGSVNIPTRNAQTPSSCYVNPLDAPDEPHLYPDIRYPHFGPCEALTIGMFTDPFKGKNTEILENGK